MWLLFALLGTFFWAIVHVLDRHCVERVFNRPWMGVITSSLASLTVFLALPFAIPFVTLELPAWGIIFLALFAGALVQLSQAFYFQALEHTEAGIVAAYWNLTPTILPLASYILLGKVLDGWHYVGIAVLVVSSVCFCLVDTNLRGRWQSFLLMFGASAVQVPALLIEKYVFEQGTFFVGFLLITVGIIASGSAPLLVPGVRRAVARNLVTLRPAIPLIVGIECANLTALFMSQRAIDLGIPSLVAAVEASLPAFTFVLAIILLSVNKLFSDEEARGWLPLKLILVGTMGYGVWLVS
jgi:uncharacterized membrane protein